MKTALIGEYTFKQWKGSATHKVQKYLLRELSFLNDVCLLELIYTNSRIKKLYSPVTVRQSEYGTIVSGGIINLIYFLLTGRFQIVHFVVIRRYMLFIAAAVKLKGAVTFTTFHDTIALQGKSFDREGLIKIFFIYISSGIFVYCDADIKTIRRFADKKKIYKAVNGVDLTRFFPPAYKPFTRVITFAGGLGKKHKGLTFLKTVIPSFPGFEFQICGENNLSLKDEAFIGELTEQQFCRQLQKSFLVIIPSEYESFSITALEAMAAGVPLIITHTAGIACYLQDGTDCLKINYADASGLKQSIKRLSEDSFLYNTISANALDKAAAFTWKKAAAEHNAVYTGAYDKL
jgi:glycosyltransferase involved in cell wall biosynthesis